MQLSDTSIQEAAEAARKSFAVVFVPGILGSFIKDGHGDIWSSSSLPSPERLALKEDWITSENVDPTVETGVLESFLGLDQYGKAMREIEGVVRKRLGLTLVKCGYDWRRDIRVGAKYLHRCLQRNGLLDPDRTVIFIAHSMGGLVTWSWHDLFYREHGNEPLPRVRGIVLLGSPLDGACEILRMMHYGYAQPSLKATKPNLAKRARAFWERERLNLVNKLTELLSRPTVRPRMFTWPGAFELLPGHVTRLTDSCVTEPDPERGDQTPWYHLDDGFWTERKPGHWILDSDTSPTELPLVLQVARSFRDWFRRGERFILTVPLFVYRSRVWFTYTRLTTIDGEVADPPFAEMLAGDGRVTESSAVMEASTGTAIIGDRRVISDYETTTYVHGALPRDPAFQATLLNHKIPMIVNAHVALAIAKRLTVAPTALLQEYVRRAGAQATLQWSAVFTHLESALPRDPSQVDVPLRGSPETERDRPVVERFNEALRTRGGLQPEEYKDARQKQDRAKSDVAARVLAAPVAYQRAAAALYLVAPSASTSPQQVVFAKANRGLALAQAQDYLTAAAVLVDVYDELSKIPDTFDRENPERIRTLKKAVTANLGIALFEIGQCEAARRYLQESLDNPRARERFEGICRDRSTGEAVKFVQPKTP